MTTFVYHEDGGHQETIEGVTTMAEALEEAAEMCREGEWGDEGACAIQHRLRDGGAFQGN